MLDNENRNLSSCCNCGSMMNNNCCCEPGMTPRVPMYSYEFIPINQEETCPEREATREEMIEEIRCLGFSIVELAQYLDTHIDDEKALCLHRNYATRLRDLKDKYQKVYGPLTINFPCNKWRWIEEPWPWERGNF